MTGAELKARAEVSNENPYFLAYALVTGAQSVEEAWERDGGGMEFVFWNSARWAETRKRIGCPEWLQNLHSDEHLETLAEAVTNRQ